MSVVRLLYSFPRVRLILTLACTTWLAANLTAERLPKDPGVWKPWKPFYAIPSARADRGASAAEVKAFEAAMLELNAIVKRAPGVATPIGFSVETWANLNGYRNEAPGAPPGKSLPLAGGFSFGAFPIFQYERNGKMIREDTGETAILQFQVNELSGWLIGDSRPTEWSGIGETDVYLQPLPRGEFAGIPRYGDFGVITKNPAPLWLPVSLQDALGVTMATREKSLKDLSESLAKMTASLEEWRTPAKRADRLKGYKESASYMPDGAKWLEGVPKMEQEIEAHMAADVAPTSSTAKSIAQEQAAIAAIKAYQDGLSPEQRQAPACYAKAGKDVRTQFRALPSAGASAECQALARSNWAFLNRSLPRWAPQVVVIPDLGRCIDKPLDPTDPSGCAANRKLLETIDRQAVLDWLK